MIIVTGGAGFIGSTLCIKLKEKYPSYRIIAFDNLKRRGSELNLIDFKIMWWRPSLRKMQRKL